MEMNSEKSKQKMHLFVCFHSCAQKFNSTFVYFLHTKNTCSKFSTDERCQIDSPRDCVPLYTQNGYSRVRKFVPFAKMPYNTLLVQQSSHYRTLCPSTKNINIIAAGVHYKGK